MSDEFRNVWLVAKTLGGTLHETLGDITDYPHTVVRCCQYQIRVDNLMQLPEDKRPPKSIWGDEKRLSEFLDRTQDPDKDTEFEVYIDESEIEGL